LHFGRGENRLAVENRPFAEADFALSAPAVSFRHWIQIGFNGV
jgi:hypothetical protein